MAKSIGAKKRKLSSKVAKADKLRVEVNNAVAKMKAVTEKWILEAENEKDTKKRKEIDRKFDRLFEEADIAESKAYQKYYNYVEENFSREDIATAMRKGLKTGKGFMGKTFINSLEGAQKKGGKR